MREGDRASTVHNKASASVGEVINEHRVERRADYGSEWRGWFSRRRLFWIIFALALFFYAQFQFWKQPSRGDRANWDYFAQVIVRGGVPYRDVVNIKSPLSAYIGAAAIIAARPFGLRDIFAIRIAFILLAALTVAFTFLVTFDSFDSIGVALLAAAIVLSFEVFSSSNPGGTQPKTPMVLFGLLTLWAILNDRPFLAGVFGMLSALSWQPGLLFVGVAGLSFSLYFTRWSDWKIVRLLSGAVIPLAILLVYFLLAGALKDFYDWTIHFTLTVYAPRELRTVANFFERISMLLEGRYYSSHVYFYLAVGGLLFTVGREVRLSVKSGVARLLKRAPRHSVIIAPIVYFGFCMIDIQGAADLIPFIPFVAAFAAVALIYMVKRICGALAGGHKETTQTVVQRLASAFVILWVLSFSLSHAFSFEQSYPTLKVEDALVAETVTHLQPGDKIFVHGLTEILVLSGLTNASKHFFLDRGKDGYLDRVEPGGFNGWFERLKSERPKIVALSRLADVDRAEEFLNWVATDYEPHFSPVFTYYVRK